MVQSTMGTHFISCTKLYCTVLLTIQTMVGSDAVPSEHEGRGGWK